MEALEEYLSVSYDRSRIQQRNRRISILLDISNFLASSLNLQQILDGSLSRVLEHFEFEGGRIYLMDKGGSHLRLAAHRGIEPGGLEAVRLDEGFSGKAATTRSFLAGHVRDLEDPNRVRLLLGKGYETVVCVPLIALDEVIGVMNLATDKVIELDQSKIDLFMIVGNQIATAANNAQLYEDVQKKVKELKEKKETIKFFAYSASHDLKCPAVGLHGLAKQFHKKYAELLDPKGKEVCEQILKTSKHMVDLADKINAYITTKESPLNIERVRVDEIIEMIRSEFVQIMEARDIEWIEPSTTPEVLADRLVLLRFFQNCVDNALKYGGERLTRIRIGYEQDSDSHIFSVTDDGVGLNQEDAEGLFQVFCRHETSKGTEGSGLGLTIVKELAERQGGKTWVQSEKGNGAAFFMSIPKRPLSEPQASRHAEAYKRFRSSEVFLQKRNES
jgi:K+-sensing histidine kinase KdpD